MKIVERRKPYKSASPKETINKIRNILYDAGLFTIESQNLYDADFHSCRIVLDSNALSPLGIGTNGKGMSREYSLASGYAEFLERVQNNALLNLQNFQATKRFIEKENINGAFLKKLKDEDLIQEFRYAPDEKYLSVDQCVNANLNVFEKLLSMKSKSEIIAFLKNNLKTDELETIPFYHVNEDCITELPIRLIQLACGTNGMCSGNNKTEAILQGLSELFERYVICEIYLKELSLPTIPLDYFEGNNIYDRIKKLESENRYTFIIKDCSLGIGFPVLGALIIDHHEQTYTMHLGADPNPATALERCFTEVYQGGKESRFKKLHYMSEDIFHNLSKNNGKSRTWNKLNQLIKTIKEGTGIWPDSIFSNNLSYSFSGFENPISESDEADLEYLLRIMRRNNFQLYIRDQSYLGFESLFIYCPEISNIFNIENNHAIERGFQFKRNFSVIANLNKANVNEIKELADLIGEEYNSPSFCEKNIRSYFLANFNFKLVDLTPEIFLVMLNYRVRDYKKAYSFLTIHLKNFKDDKSLNYIYLYTIAEFLKMKIEKQNNETIFERLKELYTENMARQVVIDLENPIEIFKYHKLPTCYDCENCQITDQCKFFDLLKCFKPLKNKYLQNMPDQKELSVVFNSLKLELVS